MPFDDDPKDSKPKLGLKKIQGQASMFDNKGPKKPTQQEFDQKVYQKVQEIQDKNVEYQKTAAELFTQFMKSIADTTLAQNKNVFSIDAEKEILGKLIQFARDANNDANEKECEGSLALIVLLFKTCLTQRDKINDLSYAMDTMQKKINSLALDFSQKNG